MDFIPRWAWAIPTVLVVGACHDSAADGEDAVVLTAEAAFPCVIRFEPTGVVLKSDAAGKVPDPGPRVSAFPNGRFVTSTPAGGAVVVWSDAGEFLQTVGRPGDGPGELGPGAYPLVDDRGLLHVIDQSKMRWSRFSPDGEFISSGTSPHFVAGSAFAAVIASDTLFTSSPPATASHRFHFLDADGDVIRAFGDITPPERSQQRSIAVTMDRTFWVGPPYGSPDYVLEEWSLNGKMLRRLRREVTWFAQLLDQELPRNTEGPPRLPVTIRPFVGPRGQLIVAIFNIVDGSPPSVWYEVIDPSAAIVLASQRFEFGEELPPTFDLAAGSNLGRGSITDELGLRAIEFVRYRLEPAAGTQRSDVNPCSE